MAQSLANMMTVCSSTPLDLPMCLTYWPTYLHRVSCKLSDVPGDYSYAEADGIPELVSSETMYLLQTLT